MKCTCSRPPIPVLYLLVSQAVDLEILHASLARIVCLWPGGGALILKSCIHLCSPDFRLTPNLWAFCAKIDPYSEVLSSCISYSFLSKGKINLAFQGLLCFCCWNIWPSWYWFPFMALSQLVLSWNQVGFSWVYLYCKWVPFNVRTSGIKSKVNMNIDGKRPFYTKMPWKRPPLLRSAQIWALELEMHPFLRFCEHRCISKLAKWSPGASDFVCSVTFSESGY